MNEVKELHTSEQIHTEIDPQVTQAGVVDVEKDQQEHLNKIIDHLQEANTQVRENTPVIEPLDSSVHQVTDPDASDQPHTKRPDLNTHVGIEALRSIKYVADALLHPWEFWQSANSVQRRTTVRKIRDEIDREPVELQSIDTQLKETHSSAAEPSPDTNVRSQTPSAQAELPNNVIPFPEKSSDQSSYQEEGLDHVA